MRIIIGSERGVHVARWVRGERAAQLRASAIEDLAIPAVAVDARTHGRGLGGRLDAPAYVAARPPFRGGARRTATSGGALYRSDDRGDTWKPVGTEVPDRRLHALAASDGRLFAGTEPAALLVSTDEGASWSELPAFAALGPEEDWRGYGEREAHVETLASDPHDSARLYAGVEIGGAYRTDDGGRSWAPVNHGLFDDIHDLAVDPADGARLYAGTGGGFHASADRGEHWRRHDSDPGRLYCTALVLLGGPGSGRPALCLATAAGPPGAWGRDHRAAGAQLWLSRDAGGTWMALPGPAIRGGQSGYTALVADPTQEEGVFVGTSDGHLFHMEDAGGRWTRLMWGLPPVQSLAVV